MSENKSNNEELDREHLGIAGRIANTFIDSPITPLFMVAMLFMGILGLIFTPRQEDPQISVPMVDIFVEYPGASSEQVASLVTEHLERIMGEIPGVKHVYSATRRGQAIVTVRFKVGQPLGPSIVKVHDKIQSNIDKIPPGVSMPLVKPKGIDDVPVVTVTLWSGSVDDGALRSLGVDVLQRLQEVSGTGQGFVVGGRPEQIRVEVYPERLNGYGISLDQIANTIRSANSEQSTGNVESGGTSFNVYSGAFLQNAQELSRLVVGIRGGAPVYLNDVANISHGPAETNQLVNHYTGAAVEEGAMVANGESAITIALAKKEGTNGVAIANRILAKLDELKGTLIPDNVQVSITRDYGKTANHKVNELLQAMFEAAAAVAILCLIGLGARAAFVVITIIPIVILITIFAAWVLGYTIDRVSLFALIFSIGILVDDATVVVENIFRRWMEAGKTTIEIAVDAVREVGNPTILATLTIISALLPMGVVRGLMGPYMLPIPVLGATAMFFSLLAAFVFTPWFAMRVRPSSTKAFEKAEEREKRSQRVVSKIFRPVIMPLVRSRKTGIIFLVGIIALTAMVCVMFYTKTVTVKMLPFDNKPEFNVVINMPEGTALPVTANVTQQLAQLMRENIAEIKEMQTYVGTASPFNFNGLVRHYYLRNEAHTADIQVMLLDKEDREKSSHALSVEARKILTPVARALGARIQVVEMPPGPPVLQTVVAEIYGPDPETRRQVARDMTAFFDKVENVVDVDNYIADEFFYWRFQVNTDKATRNGISVDTINRNLAMAMGGYKLGDVKRGSPLEPTYIVIQAPLAVRSQLGRLSNLPISNAKGESIPLGELGAFVKIPEDPIIYHKDLRSVEYVTAEMEGRLGAPIYGMFGVEDELKNYVTPDGVSITGMPMGLLGAPKTDSVSGFEWGGEWTVTYETFRDMGTAFMAAMLLIYALIVLEFKDYAIAGLIMAPIPLTLIGIIPGHWIMGAEFTATSMIGMIALGGIIVRISILIVEFVKNEVEAGKDIREAAIDAAELRLRPIFITSLTLMAGALAIVNDPIFQGMAISLLFGAGVATIFTLLVIPLGCISAEKRFYSAEQYALMSSSVPESASPSTDDGIPLWFSLWSKVFTGVTMAFYLGRAVVIMAMEGGKKIIGLFSRAEEPVVVARAVTPAPSAAPDDKTLSTRRNTEEDIQPVVKAPGVGEPSQEKSEPKTESATEAKSEKKQTRTPASPGKTAGKKTTKKKTTSKKTKPATKGAAEKKPAVAKATSKKGKPRRGIRLMDEDKDK
ncbi:MAG: efflux RND transporter permease subunit [Gammaproteobacteria bacterium]